VRLWQSLLMLNAPSVSGTNNGESDYWVALPTSTICKYHYMESDQNSRIEYNLENGSVITIL